LPKELRRLSMELWLGWTPLLDDPVFFAPFERFFDPRRVGRLSTPRANRNLGESVITKRIDADRKAGLKGRAGGATPDGSRNGPSAAGCHAEAWPQHKRGP
jgi:hypothetical protein